jgi:hypothetical protein
MVFSEVLRRFVQQTPVCVMCGVVLENVLAAKKLDELFQRSAQRQYQRELLFSTMVDLMSLVVARIERSPHSAYQRLRGQIPVSITAMYDKLRGLEPLTCRALVRHTAREAGVALRLLKGTRTPLLPGFRTLLLDGNHLGGTEHRLEVLRTTNAGALPGLSLAVLDPELGMLVDVIPCEDAHTQECQLLDPLLANVEPDDLFITDRHFCTSAWLFQLARRQAYLLTRQHAGHLRVRLLGKRRFVGDSETGAVYEQATELTDPATNETLQVRRVSVVLKQPTRDGDLEIHLLTNLPKRVNAPTVASVYRRRWNLETAFQELTLHLRCEVNTLGYPGAALFAFCVAAACYNLLALVTGSLRATHGETTIDEQLSHYYLAEELSGTYRGLQIAVPETEWTVFADQTPAQLRHTLTQLAAAVDLSSYRKHVRGPKKPATHRSSAPRQHVATERLLNPDLYPTKRHKRKKPRPIQSG